LLPTPHPRRSGLSSAQPRPDYLALGLAGAVDLGAVKLALVLGACLSLAGWQALAAATVLSYVLALLPGALIVAVRPRSLRLSLAFGPYLIAGAVTAGAGALLLT
jgi:leader peptidase (prepilin peptidase)/N-methyltransferase